MKILRFSRNENNILVEYKSTLRNVDDFNENYYVKHPSLINSYIERKMFYHFDKKAWTLNEMIFFAKNNRLCLTILENDVVLRKYGICDGEDCGTFRINTACFVVNSNYIKIN